MTATLTDQIALLETALAAGQISERQKDFASSLVSQFKKKGTLSDKQAYWVGKMLSPDPAPAIVKFATEESMAGVYELFGKAGKNLKFPALVLQTEDKQEFRLYVAGDKSSEPGSICVTSYGSREYYGRVRCTGEFVPSAKHPKHRPLISLLVALAQEPAETAAAYGRTTGRCCFCLTELTDEVSKAVGYGPTCAKNWGLPWNKTAAAAALAKAAA